MRNCQINQTGRGAERREHIMKQKSKKRTGLYYKKVKCLICKSMDMDIQQTTKVFDGYKK